MKYHHIVLFRLKEGTTSADKEKAIGRLKELGQGHQGLEAWLVHESNDKRKGAIIIVEALFAAKGDFTRFHLSEKHSEAGAFMREIADWWVGDYEAQF